MICLKPFRFRPLVSCDQNPHEIKVAYDHTRIASYRNLCVGNVGKRIRLLALDGGRFTLAGGLPRCPILPYLCRTEAVKVTVEIMRVPTEAVRKS